MKKKNMVSKNLSEGEIKTLLKPENGIEEVILSDVGFIDGCNRGKPRSGHPEGKVVYHIREVLDNVEKYYGTDPDRDDLRLIAILHDTFKHKVDRTQPKTGSNHHGFLAKLFADTYVKDNRILQILIKHDDAYNAWNQGNRRDNWNKAERRANELIQLLMMEDILELYLKFYKCDNRTGDKEQDNYDWFLDVVETMK